MYSTPFTRGRSAAGTLAGAALAALLAFPLTASAQDPRLQLDGFDRFGTAPAETVKVDIDERMMRLAAGFLKDEDAEAREILTGIKGIYVRHFGFDQPGQYQQADVDAIRDQLTRTGWVRLVEARSRKAGDNADVYVAMDGERLTGFAVVVSNAKEVTIVNVVGSIDPSKIRHLGGKLGIPDIEVGGEPRLVTPKPAAGSAKP
jgi:hypothetical protein